MDISSSSLVPRVVADLRPSADLAATARTVVPPAALAQGPAAPPVSPAEGGLVARGLLVPPAVAPADLDAAGGRPLGQPAPRVLKPWDVPMLPAEEEAGDSPTSVASPARMPGGPGTVRGEGTAPSAAVDASPEGAEPPLRALPERSG